MEFLEICRVFERIGATRRTNDKVEILSQFLGSIDLDELPLVVRTFTGVPVPRSQTTPRNVAYGTLWNLATSMFGVRNEDLEKVRQKRGDLGATVECLAKNRRRPRQIRLGGGSSSVTLEEVADLYRSLEFSGEGSYTKKKGRVRAFLDRLSPMEAKYFVRLSLSWLNIGLRDGLITRAVGKAAGVGEKLVRRAYMKRPDLGEVAKLAVSGGVEALLGVEIRPLTPVYPMLALPAASLGSALTDFHGICAAEYKYDGVRLQLHQLGDRVELFSRRLSRLTDQFPDVVEAWKSCKRPSDGGGVVVEGEVVGFDRGGIVPFQVFSRRMRRHGVDALAREIPVKLFLFDALYLDGRDITGLPHEARYELLEGAFDPDGVVQLATRLVTGSVGELHEFFKAAVAAGCEGVMLKDLRADYSPGTRGARVLKFKRVMETLDLVIVGAEYGEGKKSSVLSRFFLAAYDEARRSLLVVAKVSTGLSDDQYTEVNEKIAPLVTKGRGREVEVAPRLILEVVADEIMKSPGSPSGYSLRFARAVRVREDLGLEDADDVSKIARLYSAQQSRKGWGGEMHRG
ncbi:MAG: ATP-dependent DNA ligase [Promethearchaeota archaeon]